VDAGELDELGQRGEGDAVEVRGVELELEAGLVEAASGQHRHQVEGLVVGPRRGPDRQAQPETKRAAEPPAAALVAPEPPEPVSSTPAPPPAEPTPGPVTLEFGAAKIMPTDKPELAITLDHEGKVGLGGTPGAMTISADGKVTGADGKPIAKVDDGGVLTMAGRSTGIVLTANGLALSTPDGRKVTMVFHPETGEVVMDPPAGPGMKMVSKGCSAPVTKTCALVLSLYLLAADNQK
jgi:hypothetical protein